MTKTKPYPLQFEIEHTVNAHSYGKNASEYRLPSTVSATYGHYHEVELSSLHNGSTGIELHVKLEKAPGNHFQPGAYFFRALVDGKLLPNRYDWKKHEVFVTPNDLKVKMAQQLRNIQDVEVVKALESLRSHALVRLAVFHPFMDVKLKKAVRKLMNDKIQKELENFRPWVGNEEFDYDVTFHYEKGYYEAIIHVNGAAMESTYHYDDLLSLMQEVNENINHTVFNETFVSARIRKDLPHKGIHWHVCEHYLEDLSTRTGFYSMDKNAKNGAIAEITYKGLSIGIRVKKENPRHLLKYALYIEEGGKRKDIRAYDHSTNLIQMFFAIQKVFLEFWGESLEEKIVTIEYACRKKDTNYEEWNHYLSNEMSKEIQDNFDYSVYGEIGHLEPVYAKRPRKTILTFISCDDSLKEESKIKALHDLLEKMMK